MLFLSELHEEYTGTRRIRLSAEQFAAFVSYYPAVLVAQTDGVVDEKELAVLRGLARHIVDSTMPADTDKEELADYKLLFFNEFQYLIDHLDQWDRPFMKALRQLLDQQPELTEIISKVIYAFGNATTGIGEKENTMIEYLRSELKTSDLCKNVMARQAARPAPKATPGPRWLALFTIFGAGF